MIDNAQQNNSLLSTHGTVSIEETRLCSPQIHISGSDSNFGVT